MILPSLYIAQTQGKGRGVFTADLLPKGTIVEIAPVVVMKAKDRSLLDQTLLHDYIFEWRHDECCMALGYVSIYNHSYASNCEYEMDFEHQIIRIKTVSDIKAGYELTINYNGEWNNPKPLWFEVQS